MQPIITLRTFLITAALAILPTSLIAAEPTTERPWNFVFLLADDLGWADLACYGGDLYETPKLERSTLYWHYPHYYPTTTPVSSIRQGNWKLLHYYEDDRAELYNLADDLGEQNDLAAARPEVAKRLRTELDGLLSGVDAQLAQPNPAQ